MEFFFLINLRKIKKCHFVFLGKHLPDFCTFQMIDEQFSDVKEHQNYSIADAIRWILRTNNEFLWNHFIKASQNFIIKLVGNVKEILNEITRKKIVNFVEIFLRAAEGFHGKIFNKNLRKFKKIINWIFFF